MFLVIFRYIWRKIVLLKGFVKFMEKRNFEDLVVGLKLELEI